MKNIAFWIAIVAAIFFGASTPLSKPLLDNFTSYQLAGVLYLGACVGVLPLLIWERKLMAPWRMDRKNFLRLLGSVVFGGMLGPLALLAGLRMASAASVSMWLNLEVVATAVLGHLVFKDHLSRRGWLAVVGILLAAVILVGAEGQAGLEAGLLVALACLAWGLDNHFTALIDGITPAQSTFWKGLVAGGVNLTIGLSLAAFTGTGWHLIGGLGLGVFAYGLSIVLYIASAQQLGATRSQLIFSSAPFWGVLLSAVILSEPITIQQGMAGVLFLASIWLLTNEQHAHQHTHAVLVHEHPHECNDMHHQHHPVAPAETWHIHAHEHCEVAHSHRHQPDLHHRHSHIQGEDQE